MELTPQQWVEWFAEDEATREGFRAQLRGRLLAQVRTWPAEQLARRGHEVVTDRGVALERIYPDGRIETVETPPGQGASPREAPRVDSNVPTEGCSADGLDRREFPLFRRG